MKKRQLLLISLVIISSIIVLTSLSEVSAVSFNKNCPEWNDLAWNIVIGKGSDQIIGTITPNTKAKVDDIVGLKWKIGSTSLSNIRFTLVKLEFKLYVGSNVATKLVQVWSGSPQSSVSGTYTNYNFNMLQTGSDTENVKLEIRMVFTYYKYIFPFGPWTGPHYKTVAIPGQTPCTVWLS